MTMGTNASLIYYSIMYMQLIAQKVVAICLCAYTK